MLKKIVVTEKAPAAIGPYSVGNIAGNFVFTAGQLGVDCKLGKLVNGGIEEQTRKALENLTAILDAAGTGIENVVKVTVFLNNINDFKQMNGVYSEFFTSNPPARSAFEVADLPIPGALVEIEAVAVFP